MLKFNGSGFKQNSLGQIITITDTTSSIDIWNNSEIVVIEVEQEKQITFANAPQAGARRTIFNKSITKSFYLYTTSNLIVNGNPSSKLIVVAPGQMLEIIAETTSKFLIFFKNKGIEESNYNSNGKYVKFSDGILMQWKDSIQYMSKGGDYAETDLAYNYWNFAIPFANLNFYTEATARNSSHITIGSRNIPNASDRSIKYVCFSFSDCSAAGWDTGTYFVRYFASGFWK